MAQKDLVVIRGNEWVAGIAQTSTSKMAADEELDGNVVICRWDLTTLVCSGSLQQASNAVD